MKQIFLSIILSILASSASAQLKSAEEFQQELNEEFRNPEESPLLAEDLEKFEGLPFFEINNEFIIQAKFLRTEGAEPFEMKTTTDRLPIYEKYGEAHFNINDKPYILSIYQSHKTREMEEYQNYLFLPFTDATNGNETYGGGRFIDLMIPDDNRIVIDFNQAYNPLCSYNHKYSCPIPPKGNGLDIRIEAGVKYVTKEH